jgi:hypothetical protein
MSNYDAYLAGKQAALDGLKYDANPFLFGALRRSWFNGFDDVLFPD